MGSDHIVITCPFLLSSGLWLHRDWRSAKMLSTRSSWSGQGWEACVYRTNWKDQCNRANGSHLTGTISEVPCAGVWKIAKSKIPCVLCCCKAPYWLDNHYSWCSWSGNGHLFIVDLFVFFVKHKLLINCGISESHCTLLFIKSVQWCRGWRIFARQHAILLLGSKRLIMTIILR